MNTSPTAVADQSSTVSRAAASRVQAKLSVSRSNDSYEQEADRMADRVMTMPDAVPQRQAEEQDEERTHGDSRIRWWMQSRRRLARGQQRRS